MTNVSKVSGRRAVLFGALVALILAATGCSPSLTRENFDRIRTRVDTRAEVEDAIGEPTHDTGDAWHYEDQDRHISAQVFFDETGVVAGKQWMDTAEGTELINRQP